MNVLLFLLMTSPSPALIPRAVLADVAPMPAVLPDDKQIALWVADLSNPTADRRRIAAEGLVRVGTRAKAALPELIKSLKADQPEIPWHIAFAVLGAIGPDAKEALPHLMTKFAAGFNGAYNDLLAGAIARIDGPKPEVTLALLTSFTKVNPIALAGSQYLRDYPAQVVPHLVDLCGNKDATIREKAAHVLGGRGTLGEFQKGPTALVVLAGEGGKGVPAALEKLLTDENVTVRMTAAQAIGCVAPQLAEKTIPVTIAAVRDPALLPKVAHLANEGLFQSVPAEAAKALIPLFDEADPLRSWAIYTLAGLPVSEQLESTLKNGKTAKTRQAAAMCLGMPPRGVPQIVAARKLGWQQHFEVKFGVFNVVGFAEIPWNARTRYPSQLRGSNHSETDPTRAVAALKAALADPEFIVRFAAAQGLIHLGLRNSEAHKATISTLVEGLKQDDDSVRFEAGRYLVSVGDPAKVAIPDLKQLLADKNRGIAAEAALALVVIAPSSATEAIPALTNALSGTTRDATRAARTLAPLGPAAQAAVPELVKKFEDTFAPALRLAAAEAAARIDPTQSEKAVAILLGFLNVMEGKKRGSLRSDAAKSLGRLGSNAKSAMPTLLKVFETEVTTRDDIANELSIAMILIDPDNAKPAFTWIRDYLSGEKGYNYELLDMIKELGPATKLLMPELLALLKSKSLSKRENAIEILRNLGPAARDALPLLKELAKTDQQSEVREAAAAAVKRIEAK